MATHDYIISNQTFPSTRTDINNVLSAIVTKNSSASEPSTTYAYMWWYDTSTTTLKIRNRDDDAWISFASFDQDNDTVNFLDSEVSIAGITTSATGTVLTLTDSTITSSIDFIIDNQKEIRFRETTANGTNYVALKAPASLSTNTTFVLPSVDGTTDQVLKTDGSGNLSFTDVSGGTSWQSSIVTGSTLTAVAGNGYWINTSSNTCTITLPSSASVGDTIEFVDYARTWGTNNVTINQNSLNFQGATSPNPVYDVDGQSVRIVYSGATQGWIPTVDDDVTLETPPPYSIDFLVVAGGGAGGGSGGGSGGFRTSTQSVSTGTVITVTVGDGGTFTSVNGYQDIGASGSDSSISGSGLTTITSAGGGGGVAFASAGGNTGTSGGSGSGGSGADGGGTQLSNAGLGNTPSTSPSQGNNGGNGWAQNTAGGQGGGGGAGATGSNGSSSTGGNGGNGTASSITGSSVTYAGGGGGGGITNTGVTNVQATGGTGGGGNGANYNTDSSAGTTNLGGGGGGGMLAFGRTPQTRSASNGGKGVVILSVPTANYSATTTGSPTVTTSGSNTIMQFNGSGSYTA